MAVGPVAAYMNVLRTLRWSALAIAFAASTAWAVPWDAQKDGLQPIPPLTGPVTDLTGTLSAAERQALDTKLRDWQARTTNQLVVLMIATTAPESIEDYSIRVADAWKIGQKGVDNGAILLVAKDDKRVRIEVGYGFEGVLTDVTSRRIIAENVAPYFKQGQFAAGINAGVDRIISVVQDGKPLPPLSGASQPSARKSSGGNFDYGTLFIVLLVAVPVVGGILRSMFGNVFGSVAGAGIAGGQQRGLWRVRSSSPAWPASSPSSSLSFQCSAAAVAASFRAALAAVEGSVVEAAADFPAAEAVLAGAARPVGGTDDRRRMSMQRKATGIGRHLVTDHRSVHRAFPLRGAEANRSRYRGRR